MSDDERKRVDNSRIQAEDQLCCVLIRGIPVDNPMTDTVTHLCKPGETVEDLWKWAERAASGSAWIVRVEITKAS